MFLRKAKKKQLNISAYVINMNLGEQCRKGEEKGGSENQEAFWNVGDHVGGNKCSLNGNWEI